MKWMKIAFHREFLYKYLMKQDNVFSFVLGMKLFF